MSAEVVSLGFVVFGLIHQSVDRNLSSRLLKMRGLEKSKDEYPFELPKLELLPSRNAPKTFWVSFVVREVCFGIVRFVFLTVAWIGVAVSDQWRSWLFLLFFLALSVLSLGFLVMIRLLSEECDRQTVWARILMKPELVARKSLLPRPALDVITNVVKAAIYLQMYSVVVAVIYLVSISLDDSVEQNSVVVATLWYHILGLPLLLVFAQVFVRLELHRFPFKKPTVLAHPAFVYFPSNVRVRPLEDEHEGR